MKQIINEFINSICDLKKEVKKAPIGFITDEEDPFYDSAINKILGRLGHDERVFTIPHDIKYYLESMLREDERRYPRVRLTCSRCRSKYVFYVEPKVRHARNSLYEMSEAEHDMSIQRTIEHVFVHCTVCQNRMILTDIERIIKYEAILSSPPTAEQNPEYDFRRDRIGDPFNL